MNVTQHNLLHWAGVLYLMRPLSALSLDSPSVWWLAVHAVIDYFAWFNLPPLFPRPAPLNLADSGKQWQLYQAAQRTLAADRRQRETERTDGGMKAGATEMQRESKCRETRGAPCLCANALGIWLHLQHGFNFVNQYEAGKNVDVKIHEAKVSLKTGSLRGDLVRCLCLSTSDLGQVVLSGRQGWVGQRNNICYCSVALIRLINILHVSPAASDCVPSRLG